MNENNMHLAFASAIVFSVFLTPIATILIAGIWLMVSYMVGEDNEA